MWRLLSWFLTPPTSGQSQPLCARRENKLWLYYKKLLVAVQQSTLLCITVQCNISIITITVLSSVFFFFQIQGQQNKHIYSVNSGWSNEGLSVWLGPPTLLPSFSSLKGKPRRTLAESDNRVIRSFRAFVCSHTSNSTHYSAVSTTSRSLLCGFLSSPLKCTPSHWLGIEFGENIAAQGADCST